MTRLAASSGCEGLPSAVAGKSAFSGDGEGEGRSAATFLEDLARTGTQQLEVDGRTLRPGSRVRLRPRPGGDLLDSALAGRTALVEGIEEDQAGAVHVAVVIEDHPGRGLKCARHPAHRFFFHPGELEPLEEQAEMPGRVLVAGIGNVFLGDDGFGVAVAQQLLKRPLPPGMEVVDSGIRGLDLAYALGQGYRGAILVDALPHGASPGTLHLIEPSHDEHEGRPADGHQLNPEGVLELARWLGNLPEKIIIVGCEPQTVSQEWCPESAMRLSSPVAAAVGPAADLVLELAMQLVKPALRGEESAHE